MAAAPEPAATPPQEGRTVWPLHHPKALEIFRRKRDNPSDGNVHLKAQQGLRMVQRKLDETNAAPAGRPEPPVVQAGGEAPGQDKRHHARTEITGMARMAQRIKLVLLDRDLPPIPCKILDASAGGYRVSVATAVPLDAQLALEHTDGKRLPVQIMWSDKNHLGLKIISPDS